MCGFTSQVASQYLNLLHTLQRGLVWWTHIVVTHLLTTRCLPAHNSTTSHLQVGTGKELVARNQEKLLLQPNIGLKTWDIPAQVLQRNTEGEQTWLQCETTDARSSAKGNNKDLHQPLAFLGHSLD